MPDSVDTRFGTLRFQAGVPDQASTDKIFDTLDFQRAGQAYLLALPVVNQMANRAAILTLGPANTCGSPFCAYTARWSRGSRRPDDIVVQP